MTKRQTSYIREEVLRSFSLKATEKNFERELTNRSFDHEQITRSFERVEEVGG